MLFKQYLENLFDDEFDMKDWREKIKKRGQVIDVKTIAQKDSLTLYHGFNKDPSLFNYEFDPKKSEQGLLWFTHKFIRVYHPVEYASGKGNYMLTYELPIVKHYNVLTYEDGSQENKQPDNMRSLIEPTENCKFMGIYDFVIELPKKWFFSYKHEKFIGTSEILKASKNQITINHIDFNF